MARARAVFPASLSRKLALGPRGADTLETVPDPGTWKSVDDLFRQLHFDQQPGAGLEPMTPAVYLDRHPTHQVATPSASSWG